MSKQAWASLCLAMLSCLCVSCATPKACDPASNMGQCWTAQQRADWYGATQGSRLIPYAWLTAIEQPDSTAPFLTDSYIDAFRYIPKGGAKGVLPMGFAVDTQDDTALTESKLRWWSGQGGKEPWVGLNCSACHTTVMSYGGHTHTVDGGATMADFQSFLAALNQALVNTQAQPDKFDRFARKVLVQPVGVGSITLWRRSLDTPANRALLKTALDQHNRYERIHAVMNTTSVHYGFGRLDAFGHIFNKVVLAATQNTTDGAPPDAPVSYPFLWNVPQHQAVQWDGIAPSFTVPGGQPFDVGALVRNTGEVTGVFADVSTKPSPAGGYASSLDVQNLMAMEILLTQLRPPKWPADFPPIDPKKVEAGRTLFHDHCSGCHQVLDRADLKTPIPLQMSLFKPGGKFMNPAPGTDKSMACNAAMATSPTGTLKGAHFAYVDVLHPPLGDTAPVADMLITLAGGELWNHRDVVAQGAIQSFLGQHPPPQVVPPPPKNPLLAAQLGRDALCDLAGSQPILGYKSRPLNGIWATPPYLHNGSVPTLYDLLRPPALRTKSFYVGTRRFDPVKVGYQTAQAPDNPFLFQTQAGDQPIRGNANAGHDYGNAGFTDAERYAIIEYLKTFGETP
ncbi:di-heme-cytochrome C peroxidase [Phenylobacterium sp.]|jgi:hypothetical protein|uniref:di-heme-cytochrome C peroxidase n=1 Tax=Phenylobacterium sp. TaxID=1871053 RepID=UPI002F42509E